MAVYNSTTKEWLINLGTSKGTYPLPLSTIIKNDYAIKYGIDNTPTPEHLENINVLINNLYEPLCTSYRVLLPILPSYISPELNKYLEIDRTSLHLFGKAFDIKPSDLKRNLTNKEVYFNIKDNYDFDQVIWVLGNDNEPEYIHISYDIENGNRGDVLYLRTLDSNLDIAIPSTTYLPDIEI